MSLPRSVQVLSPERRRALAVAVGVVLGCVVLSFALAYITGNGTWFLAWWPAYIAAILVGRYTGWLWGPAGQHVAGAEPLPPDEFGNPAVPRMAGTRAGPADPEAPGHHVRRDELEAERA